MSAFGVEHTVSKAYKKIGYRLSRSGSHSRGTNDTLQDRFKVNYRQWRTKSAALSHEMNPRRWEANDAANLKAGLGPPHPRSLAARAKGEEHAREKAKNLKEGSKAMITGHANAGRKNRYLP